MTPESVTKIANDLISKLYGEAGRPIVDKWKLLDDAINWGYLRCTDAKQFKDGTWVIWVEECDPNAYHLQTYLEFKLREKGIRIDHVVCEW